MSDYYDDEYVEFADEDESDEQGFIEEEGEDIPDDLDEADAAEEPDGPDGASRPAGQRQP